MGKALIVNGGAEGLYQVQLQYDRLQAEAEIASRQTELDDIAARLPLLQAEIDTAILARDYARQVWQAKIVNYKNDPSADQQQLLTESQSKLQQQQQTLNSLEEQRRRLRLRQLSAQKRIDFLKAKIPADIEIAAWCADYNEGLSGLVGLVESGLVEGPYIIRPAGPAGDKAGYNADQDGQLTPIMSMGPAAAFVNYARLPGQAKWRPRYRLGVISSLDKTANSCDIFLDAAPSTHQRLDINQTSTLSDVPIEYMDCHAEAFANGDHVVIEFIEQDWLQPQVVGFVDHPRPCGLPPYIFIPVAPDVAGNYSHWHSLPFFDGIREIQWISGRKYNLLGFESAIGYGAGQGSLCPGYAVTPGIVWDTENHQIVPIMHPETGVEITQTMRGDGSDPANDSIYPGVYPHIAAECLGIDWVAVNIGGNDSTDPVITGDDQWGIGEGVVGFDKAITDDRHTKPDYSDFSMYVYEAPAGWIEAGLGRYRVVRNTYTDPSDPMYGNEAEMEYLVEYETHNTDFTAEFFSDRQTPSTYDGNTQEYASKLSRERVKRNPGTPEGYFEQVVIEDGKHHDNQTIYSVGGTTLFTIENNTSGSYAGTKDAECLYSGFVNHSEQAERYYSGQVQSYGTICANRHRNRIAIWKRIMYENVDAETAGTIDEIEYSNSCPLKSAGLSRTQNDSYDYGSARTTLDGAAIAALIGDINKLEVPPTILMAR